MRDSIPTQVPIVHIGLGERALDFSYTKPRRVFRFEYKLPKYFSAWWLIRQLDWKREPPCSSVPPVNWFKKRCPSGSGRLGPP